MHPSPLISLRGITVRLRDRWLLQNTSWQIRQGEQWVVWGANGAGKSTLAGTLMGRMPVVQGEVVRHYLEDPAVRAGRRPMALVSSEQYHDFFQREGLRGEMRHFSGRLQERTLAADLLATEEGNAASDPARRARILAALDLSALLEKPLDALSSGEMRKLLLARALLPDPRLLILDEPFNGLDAAARMQFEEVLRVLAGAGTQLVLITHRLEEITELFTHVLWLDSGRVTWQGARTEFAKRVFPAQNPSPQSLQDAVPSPGDHDRMPLIQMHNVTVRFGDRAILDQVNWTVRSGEHWALVGPNGAGKSTLLALVTGDQLQAYANEIILFGRPRGSGETLWEIKQQIGHLGDVLQARYQRQVTAFDVICSGFFDSVGLYRLCDAAQRRAARQWVARLGLADLAGRPMVQLSFGQQRLVLVARAMVKTPRLLILDEPCNGLDGFHRQRLLEILVRIMRGGATQLLYVSHRPEDLPVGITHRLHLEAGRVVANASGSS